MWFMLVTDTQSRIHADYAYLRLKFPVMVDTLGLICLFLQVFTIR